MIILMCQCGLEETLIIILRTPNTSHYQLNIKGREYFRVNRPQCMNIKTIQIMHHVLSSLHSFRLFQSTTSSSTIFFSAWRPATTALGWLVLNFCGMVGFLHQVSTLSLTASLLPPVMRERERVGERKAGSDWLPLLVLAEFLVELLQEQGPHIPQNPWWAVELILHSDISLLDFC